VEVTDGPTQELQRLSADLDACYRTYIRVQRRRFSWRAWFPGKDFYAGLRRDLQGLVERVRILREEFLEIRSEEPASSRTSELASFSEELCSAVIDSAEALQRYCSRLALKHQYGVVYAWAEMRSDSRIFEDKHDSVLNLRFAMDRFRQLNGLWLLS